MSEITITADVRSALGKRSRALRRTGMIPGIYYGHGQANIPVSMDEAVLTPLFRTTATNVINLKLSDGSTHMCILRDVQLDPVTERPVHFDLFGLNENEELTIEVPVKLTGGVPKGVKDGGVLQHILHRVEVTCLPKYIPDNLEINVEGLEMNHSVHVKDITIPNVKITTSETTTIVAVVPPTIVKEPEPAAVAGAVPGEAPAEPEVIAKGKKLEEGAEEGAEKAEKPEKADKKAEKK
jgi:large subunit ribosomal protein L25